MDTDFPPLENQSEEWSQECSEQREMASSTGNRKIGCSENLGRGKERMENPAAVHNNAGTQGLSLLSLLMERVT